jgi:hypothetical protein
MSPLNRVAGRQSVQQPGGLGQLGDRIGSAAGLAGHDPQVVAGP